MADVSITPEEFNEKYVPLLNAAADLIISHPEIPEYIEQSDILTALNVMKTEMGNTLEHRVAEVNSLEDQLARKDKQIKKLQETNQQLFLKVGTKVETPPEQDKKPARKSFAEIGAIINNLPG